MLTKLNDIINDYLFRKISTKEFEEKIGKKYQFQEFNQLLDESISLNTEPNKNRLFHNLFWYLPVQLSDIEKDLIYKKYLQINLGHYEHEDMLDYFHKNFINSEETIKILNDLILKPPKYFEVECRVDVFINKCLFTIAKQPVVLAPKTLSNLTHSKDFFTSKRAETYLDEWITKNAQ